RPKIFSEALPFSTGQPVAAVLVIDTSPSMEYMQGGKTRLDEAKQRALELLEDLPEGSRIAVLDTAVQLADTGSPISGQWLATLTMARDTIAKLSLPPGNGPGTRQIEQAYPMLGGGERGAGESQKTCQR